MSFTEKIKQHWKVILLCLLTVLWMNRCSVACSRESKIEKLEDQVERCDSLLFERDSIIREMTFELDMKNALLDSEKSHNSNFTSIASDNQAVLMRKVRNLTQENTKLKEDNKRQKSLINGLSKENNINRPELEVRVATNFMD